MLELQCAHTSKLNPVKHEAIRSIITSTPWLDHERSSFVPQSQAGRAKS